MTATNESTAINISDIKVDITCVHKPDFTIPELLKEIMAKSGLTQKELGDFLGLGLTQTRRVITAETPYLDETNLQTVIDALQLPFQATLYANASGRYSKRAGKPPEGHNPAVIQEIMSAPRATDERTDNRGSDKAEVFASIQIKDIGRAALPSADLMALIREGGAREYLTLDRDLSRWTGEKFFLARHQGMHMVSGDISQGIIPDRAVIEVERVSKGDLRKKDVVYVQIGSDDVATSYVYSWDITDNGIIESFEPWNQNSPTRICIEAKSGGPSLNDQRIIFGKVTRIVDSVVSF